MKHLLYHFKTLTKHPQNASELKGLILQLAIQGKLTEKWRQENPNVEPASKLLEQIKEEKKVLITEKKIKKEKPLPKIDDMEELREIPHSWKIERLGNIGDWGAGATPLRSRHDFYDGKINWFKSGELNNDVIDYESSEKITDLALEKTSVKLNKPGDVLIAMYGATIGKTGRLKVYGTTNQAVCACTPFSCITSEYLHLLLKGLKQIFLNQGEGGAQPNISRVKIRNQIFALPPLEEQKAIVAMVNELFQEVEQLEDQTKTKRQLKEDFVTSALQRLSQTENVHKEWQFLQPHFTEFFTEKETIKQLRETLLQLAVQGKLTSNWRATNYSSLGGGATGGGGIEHASELLKRIQTEKQELIAQKKIKKEKSLPPIEDHEKPYDLTEGWVWCRWIDLLAPVKYPMKRGPFGSSLRKADFVSDGIRVFEQYNPINNDPNWMRYFITKEKYKKMKAFTANEGDFLISCSGATLGRIVYLPKGTMQGIINQALLKLTLSENVILSEYFIKLFRSFYLQEKIWGKAKGMAQPNMVGVKELKNILIPLPPLKEQKAIVKEVNSLMALCDSLEEHIENSQTQIEQLMQSCLREVFAK